MNNWQWLLDSHEPWTRYRARVDLLDAAEQDPAVQADRAAMLTHPQVQILIQHAVQWPGYALKRHNDAKHPMFACATLVDSGFRVDDPGLMPMVDAILAHPSAEGPFESRVFYPQSLWWLESRTMVMDGM